MNPLLSELWGVMIKYGYETRIHNKDGLEKWNVVKPVFPDCKISWKESSKEIFKNLQKLEVNGDDGDEEKYKLSHQDWERQHYLLQHGRIIHKNNPGSLLRLMQIAYNIGQFRAEQERKSYPVKQLTYYRDNKLDSLSTYIDHISKLPDGIIDKLKANLQKASSEK
jgi:hypothetical protein